jgi:uncharacterized protein (TIGR03663 family)
MDFKAKLKQEWPAAAIVALAAVLRLACLSIKPPHFDEGVNGYFIDQMSRTGFYHYDPTNYHGPFHFYVLFLFQVLFGRHIWALRLPLALVSTACVAFATQFDRFIGRNAALWAAAAMAVSPGCIFYGRYAIHEYWLVLSLMLVAWGLAGLWKLGEKQYLWAITAGVTGAVLTKETYFIHFGCALLTFACIFVIGKISPEATAEAGPARQQWTMLDLAIAFGIFIAAVVFFYSGTFLDMPGLKGLYTTFDAWRVTGNKGNGHEKDWYYWFKLLGLYEWAACAGIAIGLPFLMPRTSRFVRVIATSTAVSLVAFCIIYDTLAFLPRWCAALLQSHMLAGLFNKDRTPQDAIDGLASACTAIPSWPYLLLIAMLLVALWCAIPRLPLFPRALAIYGSGALAAYSIIHYKTPWCIVSLTWPFLFLFGYGVDFVFKKYPYGPPVAAIAASMLAANLCDSLSLNFQHYTDEKEPYVYVQTYTDINELMDPVNALVARNPANYHLTGHILVDSYHPLPWLLGDFENVGYYENDNSPTEMDADFLLVDDTRIDDVEAALKNDYFTAPLHLRDAQDPLKLYLSTRKFSSLFPGRKPDFVPSEKPAATPTPALSPSP